MKNIKSTFLCIVILILATSLAACGGSSGGQNSVDPQLESIQKATDQQASVQETLPSQDASVSADTFLGDWADISDATRFVKITKNGTDYQYEDNEGPLPTTFKDGKLILKMSDTDTAEAYIDTTTNDLIITYQDNVSEYKKK